MKKFFLCLLCLTMLVSSTCFFACRSNGEKVSIKYFSNAVELTNMLNAGKLDAGLVAEPMASKIEGMGYNRLSVQELYGEQAYPQAVIMVSESLLYSYPEIELFIENNFNNNMIWVKENISLAIQSINGKLDSGVTPSLNENLINSEVVENCNIYYKKAKENKKYIEDYLNGIIDIDIKSAKQVKSNFYYNGSVNAEPFGKENITFVCPDGAPALGIAKFIYDSEKFKGLDINYKIISSDKIGGYLLNGLGDIVVCPINAASKLYNAGNVKYKALSIITHGNLYIMSKEKLTLKELIGKKIGVIGQGLVPDLTFKVILKNNSIKSEIAI